MVLSIDLTTYRIISIAYNQAKKRAALKPPLILIITIYQSVYALINRFVFKLRKNCCTAGKSVAVKALTRMNGDSTFYNNLLGSGVSCLKIKRLRDLEIEFLICETLSPLFE